jgi:enoyl-CoA hydratase/carnithine racemase
VIDYADGALRLTFAGPVATLTLNRPAAKNALNQAMWRALPEAMAEIAGRPELRVLIVQGAGGVFAAGADITEFPVVFADHAAALAYGALLEAALDAVEAVEIPILARIEGPCIGAGLALALACDLRLAAEDARLGAPPAKLGLMYSLGDVRRLTRAVGVSTAKSMLFTGALLDAPSALRLGLVDEVHPTAELADTVEAKARAMAELSPWSLRKAKAVMRLVEDGVRRDTTETRAWFADGPMGPDFAEGVAAFHARRKPHFG